MTIARFALCAGTSLIILSMPHALLAQGIIPGAGRPLPQVGDNFEDADWGFIHNLPKSTEDINKQQRLPTGRSTNGRWYEGIKRGHPDSIRRVATPKGGLPGSQGALALRSLRTGIPHRPSYRQQQDDFIADLAHRFGSISVSRSPSVVTRVFLPPVDEWENRTGCHFAFRVALETSIRKKGKGVFSSSRMENEVYWPGIFVLFESKEQSGSEHDYAYLRIRSNSRGGDFKGMQITQTGWWTMGLSVTPDGMVHYYAKPGIERLTAEDHITSQYPYGYRARNFRTFFFNVCNGDDGRTWSTEWIIDDPTVYVGG